MLEKKYSVSKSFKMDYRMADDLEYLSMKLDRPQRELLDIALENLIFENRKYFIEEIVIDKCYKFFEWQERGKV